MRIVQKLAGKKIFLDSSPLIYYIEGTFFPQQLNELFRAAERQECVLVSSMVTLAEVLVIPLREKNWALVEEYEDILLNSTSITQTELVGVEIAQLSAKLRAKYISLKALDALQLATAIYITADCFLTNDKRLSAVKEIEVILLEEIGEETR